MRTYIRNRKGQFASKKFTGKTIYFKDNVRYETKGFNNARKQISILETYLTKPIIEIPRTKVVDILQSSEIADKVEFTNTKGEKVKYGYKGKVKITYYKNGKKIQEFDVKGLSKEKELYYKPRAIGEREFKHYKIKYEKNKTFLECMKKTISSQQINRLDNIRIIMKVGGKEITINESLEYYIEERYKSDLRDYKRNKGKGKPPIKWNKTYALAYIIRDNFMARQLRFSSKGKIRGNAYKQSQKINTIDLTIQKL
jgi:hypothetical protein